MIDKQLDAQLKEWMSAHHKDMIKDLQELVGIESISEVLLTQPAPFGEGVKKALEAALGMCQREGLETRNFDFWCGDATYGQGEGVIGAAAHLDTVPFGEGWTHNPTGGEIQDGIIYGRGVGDNKVSAVALLYAVKAMKELGIVPKKKVRIIFGCNEEIGMLDMPEYLRRTEAPDYTFVPDAGFPACNGEKGVVRITFRHDFKKPSRLAAMAGGTRVNVIPEHAEATLRGVAFPNDLPEHVTAETHGDEILVKSFGMPGHGAAPASGRNAIVQILPVLRDMLPPEDGAYEAINGLCERVTGDFFGEKLGIACKDDISGELTINMGVIECDGKSLSFQIDMRQPVLVEKETSARVIKETMASIGFTIEKESNSPGLYQPIDSPLVSMMQQVYADATGDNDSKPFAIGGGTYARCFPNAVSCGFVMPGSPVGGIHAADEHIGVDDVMGTARVFVHLYIHLAQL